MDGRTIATLIAILLSAGGAAFLSTLFKGLGSLRLGTRARERETVDQLARWRDEADARRRAAEADRDFWRLTASRYSGQLARAGIDPVPPDPVAPSERPPPAR